MFVDETHSDPHKTYVQIKGPLIYFSFEIANLRMVNTLVSFLENGISSATDAQSENLDDTLCLNEETETAITFIRDKEYTDRCYVMLGAPSRIGMVRYSVEGADLEMLTESFREVRNELQTEGIIPSS